MTCEVIASGAARRYKRGRPRVVDVVALVLLAAGSVAWWIDRGRS